MEERRRSARTDLEAELIVKRLDQKSGDKVNIHILDVSKNGIGFNCSEQLEKGAFYEIYLTIWTKETIHSVVEIVRAGKILDEYTYGAEFIGMTDTDAQRIQVYQTVEAYKS